VQLTQTPKFIEIQLPENGNQCVSGLPAFRQQTHLNRLTPAKLTRNRLGNPFRVGDEETGRRREIAAGPFKQTSSARETESNHYEL